MIRVVRTMVVRRPMDQVVDHLADFTRAREWDPATVACVRLDEGPVRPGARWRNTSRFRGRTSEVSYRLDIRARDHLVFVGENSRVHVTDDLRFTEVSGASTRLVYGATFRFKGLARLAEPFLRREVDRLADDVAVTLPRAMTS
ncbi:SRPBCC family protein [Streptomyces sp. WAC06614]|uniref:SRPBCC family protein n=1 Tax=Streptomyces sp. WAC06614 TaxID=2487416 RepID=UPI000F78CA02|nr:SRPBCC family protein [Streptomyces sp. WAC06614]RSS80680.1 polyketide cyclase [Streptomyces sp. WAC06614]